MSGQFLSDTQTRGERSYLFYLAYQIHISNCSGLSTMLMDKSLTDLQMKKIQKKLIFNEILISFEFSS